MHLSDGSQFMTTMTTMIQHICSSPVSVKKHSYLLPGPAGALVLEVDFQEHFKALLADHLRFCEAGDGELGGLVSREKQRILQIFPLAPSR